MKRQIVALLQCPACGEGLEQREGSLVCPHGHTFDLARQGYVNLLGGRNAGFQGDSAQMVAAREAFLAAGHFAGLRAAVAAEAAACAEAGAAGAPAVAAPTGLAGRPAAVLEVGAGTGYYLAGVLDRLPGAVGLALDLSKPALRRAARAHDRMGAAAADVWGALPVRDGAVDLVLDVFAPRNAAEFRRVLRPAGCLVVVTPSPRHLHELVAPLGLLAVDPDKQERLDRSFSGVFDQAGGRLFEEVLRLGHDEVAALAEMGPSARHVSEPRLKERLRSLPPVVFVTVSVDIAVYRPV